MDAPFLGTLREEKKKFIFREIFMKNLEDMSKRPCKRATLSLRGSVGETGGASFIGNFERKGK